MARASGKQVRFSIRLTGAADDALSVKAFLEAVQETIGILRDLDEAATGKSTLEWHIVGCSMKSPLKMTFEALPKRDATPAPAVVEQFIESLNLVGKGRAPDYFPDVSLERARRIGALLSGGLRKIDYLVGRKKVASPSAGLVHDVERVLRTRFYFERTTIEGRLEILDAHLRPKFAIFDVLTGVKTVCEPPVGQFNTAYAYFNARVAVTGLGKFNREGHPVGLTHIERIERLHDQGELPRFADVEGTDFTEGEDPVSYIRRMRDAG